MDNNKTLFQETQRFSSFWWAWGLMVLIVLPFGISLYKHWAGWQTLNTPAFIIPCIVLVLVNALIFSSKLETIIKADGVYVKFFPFHFSLKRYNWQMLQQVYVRKYYPLSEYGGWGLRWGIAGKAYNISGKWGIQLITKNGKRLLIGTQRAEEARKVLEAFYGPQNGSNENV